MDKIAIIGMGLIGTSIGLALKKAGLKNIRVVGTDRDRGRAATAQKMKAVDQTAGLGGAVDDADIVVLATPVVAMKDTMEAIAHRLSEGCLVTDTGGNKGIVINWADQFLPKNVNFVGGQPLVGKEGSGPEKADATLFQGKPYCIVPGIGATKESVRLLTDLVNTIEAKPYFIDASEHDSYMTAVGHLPFLLSVALLGCTSKSPSWDDIAKMASAPYKTATSLASGDPATFQDLASGDTETIVHWLDAFIIELHEIRQILAEDRTDKQAALEKVLNSTFEARNRWLAGVVTPASQAAANRERLPSASQAMSGFLLGDSEARRRLFGGGPPIGYDKDKK